MTFCLGVGSERKENRKMESFKTHYAFAWQKSSLVRYLYLSSKTIFLFFSKISFSVQHTECQNTASTQNRSVCRTCLSLGNTSKFRNNPVSSAKRNQLVMLQRAINTDLHSQTLEAPSISKRHFCSHFQNNSRTWPNPGFKTL